MPAREEPAPPPPRLTYAPPRRRFTNDLDLFGCGRSFYSPQQFLEKYVTLNKDPTIAKQAKTFLEKARDDGYSDEEIADVLIKKDQVQSKLKTHFNPKRVLLGIAFTLLVGVLAWASLSLVYLVILYVVYGYARVKNHFLATVSLVRRVRPAAPGPPNNSQ